MGITLDQLRNPNKELECVLRDLFCNLRCCEDEFDLSLNDCFLTINFKGDIKSIDLSSCHPQVIEEYDVFEVSFDEGILVINNKGSITAVDLTSEIYPKIFTLATRPATGRLGQIIFVSDDQGGSWYGWKNNQWNFLYN